MGISTFWRFGILISSVFMATLHTMVDASKEIVEIGNGEARWSVADVLFIVDMSGSVDRYNHTMIESLIELISYFGVSESGLRVALIECKQTHHDLSEDEVIKLYLDEGITLERVIEAIGNMTSKYENPFTTCFKAAINKIFKNDKGDRPDIPNVIIFLSDLQWGNYSTVPEAFEPKDQIAQLKRTNTTIISIAFCIVYERCRKENEKVASELKYALKMDNFSANNQAIRDALQHSFSCKQAAELDECTWTSETECNRNIDMAPYFSSPVCQNLTRKPTLLTNEAVRNDTKCANVTKLTGKKSCSRDHNMNCVMKTVEITRRAANRFDVARNPGAIDADMQSCMNQQSTQDKCPEIECKKSDCVNEIKLENCDSLAVIANCRNQMQHICRGTSVIDLRCYPLYYAGTIKEGASATSETSSKSASSREAVKEFCENIELRINCSDWLIKTFNTTVYMICKEMGSTISVDCLKNFQQEACSPDGRKIGIEEMCNILCDKTKDTYIDCIQERIKVFAMNTTVNNNYPCTKQLAALRRYQYSSTIGYTKSNRVNENSNPTLKPTDIDRDRKVNKPEIKKKEGIAISTPLIVGLILVLLLILTVCLAMAIFIQKRRKQDRKQFKNFITDSKQSGGKTEAVEANLKSELSLSLSKKTRPSTLASKTGRSSKTKGVSKTGKSSKTEKSQRMSRPSKPSKTSTVSKSHKNINHLAKNFHRIKKDRDTNKS